MAATIGVLLAVNVLRNSDWLKSFVDQQPGTVECGVKEQEMRTLVISLLIARNTSQRT